MAMPQFFYLCCMSKYKQQSHVDWECGYHIVWCPKYRFRILTGVIKEMVDKDVRLLCEWKNCDLEEFNIQPDHIHMLVSIPSKVLVSKLMGVLKGKLAIKFSKNYPQLKQKPYWGNHFWSRGYFVNTVGLNEDMIRRYAQYQEGQDKKEENNGRHFTLFDLPKLPFKERLKAMPSSFYQIRLLWGGGIYL